MATPIGQNKDGSLIYEQNMSVAPKSTFKPITPASTGIPGVGVPQVPGLQPIVPQTLIDKSQPMQEDKTPEAFKSMIVTKFPEGVTNDGRKYADLDPYEITDMIVKKFPNGVTNAGTPYKDYLQAPKNRREAFMASGANKTYKIDENKFTSFIKDITAPYRGVKTAMESGSIGLQSVIADGMDLVGMDTTAENLRKQLTADKQALGQEMKDDKGLIGGIQAGDPASAASALFSGVTSLLMAGNLPGAVALGASTAGNISLEGEEQMQGEASDKAFAYGAGTISALLDRISAGKILDGLLAKGVKPSVAKGLVKKTEGFLKYLKPSDFEAGTEILQQRIEDWGRDLMGVEYDRNWKDYAEAGLMGKILGKVGDSDTQTLNDVMGEKKPGVGTKLTRGIPEKTVANYLDLTPTERANVENILGGKTAEQYILENNLGGKTKGELTDIFQKQASDSYNGIKEELKKITERIESKGAKTAIDDMLETFEGLSSLEKSVYENDINYLKKLAEQDDYTLSELHALRQAFDKVNTGMYTAKGAVRSGTRAGAEVEVRNALSNDIQENAIKNGVDVKKMNQDLRVALTLKDGLLRSLSQEAKNNLVGLQDIGIMGIFSGGEPLTALSLGIGKKFLEGQMPGVAQKLYNLNKAPYENTAVKRGNTIATGTGSRLFGLPTGMGDSDASGIPQVKPNVIISKNPAEILAFELSNGKVDIKKAIEEIKKLSPEEIAKHPELVKLQEVQTIVEDVNKIQNKYGRLPQKEIDNTINRIEGGNFTEPQKDYMYSELPTPVKKQVQEINFARDYPDEVAQKPKLKPKTEKKVKAKKETPEVVSTPETVNETSIDKELQSIQESAPENQEVLQMPEDYMPTDGLPTGEETIKTIQPKKFSKKDIKDIGPMYVNAIDADGNSFFLIKGKIDGMPEGRKLERKVQDIGGDASTPIAVESAGTYHGVGGHVLFDDGTVVNELYLNKVKKAYPDATFYVDENNKFAPIVAKIDNEVVGVIMPTKDGKIGFEPTEAPKTPQVEVNDFYKERLAINKKKLEDTNKRLKELNDSTDTTLQGQRNNFAEKKTLEIDKKMLEDSIAGFEETLGKSPQVEGKTDGYLYHGTSQGAFEKIQKEGIKPQRRGVSSLSKTEEYSKNWAFPEATGTKGVMLRVKKDFMKDKLFNTKKQRPKSDEMYEVLTKETIPPEQIEMYKDGKWQPLVNPKQSLPLSQKSDVKYSKPIEDALVKEARKYKSAEEFVKNEINAYHGTTFADSIRKEGFKQMESERGGFGSTKVKSPVHFFTENPKTAKFFADDRYDAYRKGKPEVIGVKLETKNPLNLVGNVKTAKIIKTFKDAGVDLEKYFGYKRSDLLNKSTPSNLNFSAKNLWTFFDDADFVNGLKKQGYDSAILQEDLGLGKSIAVFDSKQILTDKQLKDIYSQSKQ